MSHNLLHNTNFHALLFKIDQELSKEVQKAGCPECKGQLDKAPYPRVPHGLSRHLRIYYEQRLSFCCAKCRRRVTPQSVRFFGRRWFVAPIFIFISAITLGINERRLEQLKRHCDIHMSESTWKRWRRWWREIFCLTPFWRQAKGLLAEAYVIEQRVPRSLFSAFEPSNEPRIIVLLRFLSPLTAAVCHVI